MLKKGLTPHTLIVGCTYFLLKRIVWKGKKTRLTLPRSDKIGHIQGSRAIDKNKTNSIVEKPGKQYLRHSRLILAHKYVNNMHPGYDVMKMAF